MGLSIVDAIKSSIAILFFPSGLFLLIVGLLYEWADRKLLAQLQNRVGSRSFQPLADVAKLLAKEGSSACWFITPISAPVVYYGDEADVELVLAGSLAPDDSPRAKE
jgi:NADH:ubiquinone oxidoreductase subunit H